MGFPNSWMVSFHGKSQDDNYTVDGQKKHRKPPDPSISIHLPHPKSFHSQAPASAPASPADLSTAAPPRPRPQRPQRPRRPAPGTPGWGRSPWPGSSHPRAGRPPRVGSGTGSDGIWEASKLVFFAGDEGKHMQHRREHEGK